MDLKWITQMAKRVHELEEENKRLKCENKREPDMTKPQPCTKFRHADTVEWVAKLSEETNEVIQEAKEMAKLYENQCAAVDLEEMGAVQDRLALELTDVIHVCISWLDAEGWDEEARGELHRRVNEKNRERGYF